MKIDVRAVKNYSKLITKFVDTGHPQFSTLYLDFKEQRIYFGSNRGFGMLVMPVTDYDPKAKPFCVSALSFIAVAEATPLLDVEGFVFRHESGDSFQIAHTAAEDFEVPNFGVDLSDATALDEVYIPAIRRAGVFTTSDGAKNLDGIFVRDGHVFGLDGFRMYDEALPTNDNLVLPRNVWEILVLETLENPKIKIDEHCIWIVSADMNLQFPIDHDLSLPEEVGTDDFRAQYQHKHSVRVSKNTLINYVQFFLPFVTEIVQQRIQFIFNNASLEIKTEDGNVISRHIAYSEPVDSYFNGRKIWVSALWIKNILSCLPNGKDATVEISVDFDKPPVKFSVVGDDAIHIVYSRIKDSV